MLKVGTAYCVRKHFRFRQALVGHKPISIDLSTYPAYLPHRGFVLERIHHRNLSMGSKLQGTKEGSSNRSQSSCSAKLHALHRL